MGVEPVLTNSGARRTLRKLELEAYAAVVSAFRAQGPLTNDKRTSLDYLSKLLGISSERHRAEIRRAVNDDLLGAVAGCLTGCESDKAWRKEGQKLASTNPRFVSRPATHIPQVLTVATLTAAMGQKGGASTTVKTTPTSGQGTNLDFKKAISLQLQNALKLVMSQNPSSPATSTRASSLTQDSKTLTSLRPQSAPVTPVKASASPSVVTPSKSKAASPSAQSPLKTGTVTCKLTGTKVVASIPRKNITTGTASQTLHVIATTTSQPGKTVKCEPMVSNTDAASPKKSKLSAIESLLCEETISPRNSPRPAKSQPKDEGLVLHEQGSPKVVERSDVLKQQPEINVLIKSSSQKVEPFMPTKSTGREEQNENEVELTVDVTSKVTKEDVTSESSDKRIAASIVASSEEKMKAKPDDLPSDSAMDTASPPAEQSIEESTPPTTTAAGGILHSKNETPKIEITSPTTNDEIEVSKSSPPPQPPPLPPPLPTLSPPPPAPNSPPPPAPNSLPPPAPISLPPPLPLSSPPSAPLSLPPPAPSSSISSTTAETKEEKLTVNKLAKESENAVQSEVEVLKLYPSTTSPTTAPPTRSTISPPTTTPPTIAPPTSLTIAPPTHASATSDPPTIAPPTPAPPTTAPSTPAPSTTAPSTPTPPSQQGDNIAVQKLVRKRTPPSSSFEPPPPAKKQAIAHQQDTVVNLCSTRTTADVSANSITSTITQASNTAAVTVVTLASSSMTVDSPMDVSPTHATSTADISTPAQPQMGEVNTDSLIQSLCSDSTGFEEDPDVTVLASQLGLDSVNSPIFNLSGFLSLIQPDLSVLKQDEQQSPADSDKVLGEAVATSAELKAPVRKTSLEGSDVDIASKSDDTHDQAKPKQLVPPVVSDISTPVTQTSSTIPVATLQQEVPVPVASSSTAALALNASPKQPTPPPPPPLPLLTTSIGSAPSFLPPLSESVTPPPVLSPLMFPEDPIPPRPLLLKLSGIPNLNQSLTTSTPASTPPPPLTPTPLTPLGEAGLLDLSDIISLVDESEAMEGISQDVVESISKLVDLDEQSTNATWK